MFFHQLDFKIHIEGKQETFVPVKSFSSLFLAILSRVWQGTILLTTSVQDYINISEDLEVSLTLAVVWEKVEWTDRQQSMDKIAH